MNTKLHFHRAAWKKDHWVRTHAMWNVARTRRPSSTEELRKRTLKYQPEYETAKHQSDFSAAQEIVNRLMSADTLNRLEKDIKGQKPLIVCPSTTQHDPNNVIPFVFMHSLAYEFSLDVDESIYIKQSAARTGFGGIHRFLNQPAFKASDIPHGQTYMVVDDVCTMGGTMANLVQYIENHGGRVIAISSLADGDSSPEAKIRRQAQDFLLNASKDNIVELEKKYGVEFNNELFQITGLQYETLTDREALFLLHQYPQLVRDELLQMAHTTHQPSCEKRK